MNAIPTYYDGITFRSRLEARWAVFFKSLGINYCYEHQGYVFDHVCYLPDFYIPHLDCFIEIKGVLRNLTDEIKPYYLAKESKKHVYVFIGDIPNPEVVKNKCFDPNAKCSKYFRGEGYCDEDYYCWCECPQCKFFGIEFEGKTERLNCGCNKASYYPYTQNILKSYYHARNEKFENRPAYCNNTITQDQWIGILDKKVCPICKTICMNYNDKEKAYICPRCTLKDYNIIRLDFK